MPDFNDMNAIFGAGEDGKWRYERERLRSAREDELRVRRRRALLRRLRYPIKRGGQAMMEGGVLARLMSRALAPDDERTAEEQAALASASGRAQARVELAVQRSAFPRLTPRFLREHPEKVAAIRQLSRQYERARSASRYRQWDREHQAALLAQRERLIREAWTIYSTDISLARVPSASI